MISCLILTAGLSRRFGSPKALAKFNGETIIEHLQNQVLQSSAQEIIVVLGAHREDIEPSLLNHKKIRAVYNKDYNFGQTSSVKEGLRAGSPAAKGFLVLPVDYPFVLPQTLDEIIRFFQKENAKIVIPVHEAHKGHPPLFSSELKNDILDLENSAGLNTLAQTHQEDTKLLAVKDRGVITTFNTPEEFEAVKKN